MLLAAKLHEIAAANGGELAVPVVPSAGSLNERQPAAILTAARDVLRNSPAPGIILGSGTRPVSDGNAVKFTDEESGELARDFYYDPETGEALNSIGLKNPGEEGYGEVVREASIIAEDMGKLLLMSVSSIGEEDPSVVIPELTEKMFENGAHGVEINLGCPNKVELSGKRHAITGRDPEATEAVLQNTVDRVGTDRMLGAKLSWYYRTLEDGTEDYHDLKNICAVISRILGIDFVTLTNTEPNVVMQFPDGSYVLDKIPGNAGGGSGPARAEEAYQQLLVARRHIPKRIDIISATGVYDGAEVLRRERGEAILSAMVTRLWQGAKLGKSYTQSLKEVHAEYLTARELELLNDSL